MMPNLRFQGVLIGAAFGLVFGWMFAEFCTSPGAGLLWGLAYAFLLWMVVSATIAPWVVGNRQASAMLDALAKLMRRTSTAAQRTMLLEQAEMILRVSEESVPESSDRADVRRRYDAVVVRRGAESGIASVREDLLRKADDHGAVTDGAGDALRRICANVAGGTESFH